MSGKSFNIKERRPKVLLLGNGVFYAEEEKQSWLEVIKRMKRSNAAVEEYYGFIPYSILATAVTDVSDTDRQKKYATEMHTLDVKKPYLGRILQHKFDAIITTNYTYEIENYYHPGYSKLSNDSKRTYVGMTSAKREGGVLLRSFNQFRSDVESAHEIWHMHGELRRPSSMVLTQDEYARLVQKILNYLSGRENEYVKFEDDLSFKSWIDYLIMGDVFIIGQGLDFAEFDLWWLLSRRMRERGSVGKVYYFDRDYSRILGENKMKAHYDKVLALKALNVKVEDLGLEMGCEDEAFFDALDNRLEQLVIE